MGGLAMVGWPFEVIRLWACDQSREMDRANEAFGDPHISDIRVSRSIK
jgi:hypothetical protein